MRVESKTLHPPSLHRPLDINNNSETTGKILVINSSQITKDTICVSENVSYLSLNARGALTELQQLHYYTLLTYTFLPGYLALAAGTGHQVSCIFGLTYYSCS